MLQPNRTQGSKYLNMNENILDRDLILEGTSEQKF
jgi:hypothetical protein